MTDVETKLREHSKRVNREQGCWIFENEEQVFEVARLAMDFMAEKELRQEDQAKLLLEKHMAKLTLENQNLKERLTRSVQIFRLTRSSHTDGVPISISVTNKDGSIAYMTHRDTHHGAYLDTFFTRKERNRVRGARAYVWGQLVRRSLLADPLICPQIQVIKRCGLMTMGW